MKRAIRSVLASNPAALLSLLGRVPPRDLATEMLLAGQRLVVRLGVHDRRQRAVAEVRRAMEIIRFQWPMGDRTWGRKVAA